MSNNSDGKRDDGKAAPASYTCQSELCRLSGFPGSGPAEKMFNLPVNPGRTTVEDIAPRIRCAKCAEGIARENGKQLYEPGCGTYPLHFTLGQIKMTRLLPSVSSFREVKRQEQVEEENYAVWAERSQERRRSEERHRRATSYAREYLTMSFSQENMARMPQPVEANDIHYCGLPRDVGCCGGDERVMRFLTVCGLKVGICGEASRAFLEVAHEHRMDDRRRRLLWTEDETKIEVAAAAWSGDTDQEK